jgi:hypothetical protein
MAERSFREGVPAAEGASADPRSTELERNPPGGGPRATKVAAAQEVRADGRISGRKPQ